MLNDRHILDYNRAWHGGGGVGVNISLKIFSALEAKQREAEIGSGKGSHVSRLLLVLIQTYDGDVIDTLCNAN